MMSKLDKAIEQLGFFTKFGTGILYCHDKGMKNNYKLILADICTFINQGYNYGLSAKSIANRLNMSTRTVKSGLTYLDKHNWIYRHNKTINYLGHDFTFKEVTNINHLKIILETILSFLDVGLDNQAIKMIKGLAKLHILVVKNLHGGRAKIALAKCKICTSEMKNLHPNSISNNISNKISNKLTESDAKLIFKNSQNTSEVNNNKIRDTTNNEMQHKIQNAPIKKQPKFRRNSKYASYQSNKSYPSTSKSRARYKFIAQHIALTSTDINYSKKCIRQWAYLANHNYISSSDLSNIINTNINNYNVNTNETGRDFIRLTGIEIGNVVQKNKNNQAINSIPLSQRDDGFGKGKVW